MAAITSAVVAVAGIGMSVGQMIHQTNLKNQAEQAGAAAAARIRGIEEINKLSGLQVPTEGIELAKEQQARRDATLVPLIQEDARTALGGATSIAQTGAEKDIKLAAKTGKAIYERDAMVLGEEAAIEKRKAERQAKMAEAELTGAGEAARAAREGQAAAATSALKGAAVLGGKIATKTPGYGWDPIIEEDE